MNLRTAVFRSDVRLLLVIGTMLVFAYYGVTFVDVWPDGQMPATIWHRIRLGEPLVSKNVAATWAFFSLS